MHVFLHFKSFGLVVLQLILASKLSELEQFEKQAQNCLFANKIEFLGKWLHPRANIKKTDPCISLIVVLGAHNHNVTFYWETCIQILGITSKRSLYVNEESSFHGTWP